MLPGLLGGPVRTRLIPARMARRSRKGGGSGACREQGAGKRSYGTQPHQRKVCMVKANGLNPCPHGLPSGDGDA